MDDEWDGNEAVTMELWNPNEEFLGYLAREVQNEKGLTGLLTDSNMGEMFLYMREGTSVGRWVYSLAWERYHEEFEKGHEVPTSSVPND